MTGLGNIDDVYKHYLKVIDENQKLKERNDSLNIRDINLCRIANGIRDENFALKELLKECKPYFNALVEKRLKLEYIPQVYELLTKIDNAIGEKK